MHDHHGDRDRSWPRDVLVIHNEKAGDGSQPASLLRQVLADAGYRPRYVSTEDDWRTALQGALDMVVLIGGDGTISRAVRLLGGRDIRVALLPTGTANNLAKTMGVGGDARDVVRSWRDGFVLPLDVWEATTASPERVPFVEAIGGGLVATVIAHRREVEPPTLILGSVFDRALHLLREAARDEPARTWGVEVDGADHSGDLIGIEVMNGPYVGPNIPLAPEAGPGDAGLDVVIIRPEHRDDLFGRFRTLAIAQTPAPGALDIVKGRDVRIRPPGGVNLHVDGDTWVPDVGADGWLRIEPAGPVSVLVGRRDDDGRAAHPEAR